MKVLSKFSHLIARFSVAKEAVAAVEFALILPALMMLYMGTLEVSQVISVDRKMAAAAGALGDLVTQSDAEITTATLNDYFQAAGMIMSPYSSNTLKQLVTQVYVAADGSTSVKWSVGYNGATAKVTNSSYALPSEITDITRDMHVVVSEAQIPYAPWGGYVLDTSFNLYKQFFYVPRFGAEIALI